MRIRLFGHYWHTGMALLWLAESVVGFAGCWVAFRAIGEAVTSWTVNSVQALVSGLCVMIAMIAMGMFSNRLRDRTAGIVLRIAWSVGAGSLLGALLLSPSPQYRLTIVQCAGSIGLTWLLLVLVRMVAVGLMDEDIFKRRVLVFGAGNNAARILRLRRRADQRGFKLTGFVPAKSEVRRVSDDKLLTSDLSLLEIAAREEVDEIVVAMDDRRQQFPLKELLDCRLSGIEVTELVTFLERETGKIHLDILNPSWMIFGGGFRRDFVRRYSERTFDLVASSVLLLIAAPVMLLTAIAIKIEEGLHAPVVYSQPRVGYAGRVFRVQKFRSMRVDAEKDGKARWAQKNDDRITCVGSFIRKTRIDELPQLFNVFRGQMSFVGPRPERPEFVQQFEANIPYYRERHSVKPGITGWAQLCYAYGASEQDAVEKLQYDLYYVRNHGLIFDFLILLQTVEVVLFKKGAR